MHLYDRVTPAWSPKEVYPRAIAAYVLLFEYKLGSDKAVLCWKSTGFEIKLAHPVCRTSQL